MNHTTPPPESPESGMPTALKASSASPAEQPLTKGEIQIIAGTAALAAAHVILPKPAQHEEEKSLDDDAKDQAEEEAEPVSPTLKYGPVGEIVSKTRYAGETHTGEVLDRYVDLYRGVFSHGRGIVTYFDAQGNSLAEEVLPDNWYVDVLGTPKEKGQKPPVVRPKMTEAQQQEWHNRHRIKARTTEKVLPTDHDDLGYPFIATATVYGMDKRDDIDSPFELLDERLNDEVKDPSKRYFEGRGMSLRQAIIEIATAYDVPRAVAFGIGANESAFDREAVSTRKKKGKGKGKDKVEIIAKGMFQFKPEGYEDAKNYAAQHPELSASIRKGALLGFEQRFHGGTREWKNRFVSIEMFCAYYRYIQEMLSPHFDQLEERLRKLDPTLLVGTFDTIGTINAYNAGPSRIKECIERFIKLSDEELKKKIGEPPYGVDVWMAVLAHSFGAKFKDTQGKERKTGVGPHVLMYAPKSLALGSLIMDEENHLSGLERNREEWEMPVNEENLPEKETIEKAKEDSRRSLLRAFSALTRAGAVGGGVTLGAQAVQEGREGQGLSRRTLLRGAAALAAGTVVLGKSIASSEKEASGTKDGEIPAPPGETPRRYVHEKYDENILRQAKATLDATYEVLKKRRKGKQEHKGNYDWTSNERDRIRKYTILKQTKALRPEYEAAFGKDWVQRFLATKPLATQKRRSLYEEGEQLQQAYIQQAIAAGEFVPMEEDNEANSYFCEQVGKMSGTKNDVESLYMHKEFVPLIGSIIELVNHQIDLFNQNQAAYGVLDPEFPIIPHVNAVKISGALRSVMQTYRMLMDPELAGRTSKDLGPHWIGQAIDLGSFTTQGSHMVAFAEPLFYPRQTQPTGTPRIPANSKLPSQGFGGRTREILSKMFGRALLALEEPLKEKGIILMPLWEGKQLNWHVAINP